MRGGITGLKFCAFGRFVGRHLAEACRRQPLAAVAALFLAGIAAGYREGDWVFAVCGTAACLCLAAVSRRSGRWTALLAVVFFLGWTRAGWDSAGQRRAAARFGSGKGARETFVCRVGPEVTVTRLRGAAAKRTFQALDTRLASDGAAVRYLPVTVQWFGAAESPDAPRPGERWRLTGRASVRKGRSGLLALTINTGEERAQRLETADPSAWAARIERARREAARRVTLGIADWGVIPSLNTAMLLGSRQSLSPAMRRIFADSGTIHVFAISGLHIVLVAAVLVLAVSALGVPRPYWVVAIAPLLVFYTVTTGARPSAIRACLMALLYFAAPLLNRRPSGLAALAGTALLVHVWQPWLAYDIGSVLSFVVMGGLVVFCRPFGEAAAWVCRVPQLEERARLLEAAGEKMAARRWRRVATAVRYAADSFAVSLAAWLASVPLTAYYFGRFTPGGLAANLVIAPCALMVVTAGCLGLATSFSSVWLASCFNHAAGFFTAVMVKTAELTAACPWGTFRVSRWSAWQVGGWFAGLALGALGLALVRARRSEDGLAWLTKGAETERVQR